MKRIFVSACLLLAAQLSNAQKDSTALADSFYLLSPVQVRALRLNAKSPFASSNLQSKDLQKQNLGQNMPYLLGQVPSVVVNSDDGAGVGYSSLRIRGTDMSRINVTLNGIPVNDAESQAAIFVDLPDLASSTTTIQIQRGVGSSTNGSGAFGGSINIANLEQSQQATATVSNSYGSFNTWKHTLQAGTGLLRGGFQFDLRLSKIHSSGYVDRGFSDLASAHFIGSWTSKDEKSNIKFNYLTGKERTGQAWNGLGISYTDETLPANFNYQRQLDSIGRKTNPLGFISPGNYYKDQTDNYRQDYYQLFLNHRFNNNWSANLSGFLTRGLGYYNEYKKGEFFSDYFLPDYIKSVGDTLKKVNLTRQLWLDNYYYGTVFSTQYTTPKTQLVLGGAYTRYDGKHYGFIKWADFGVPLDHQWYDLKAHKTDFNIYGKWQQELALHLYGFVDLQFRNVDYHLKGFRKKPKLPAMNPKYHFFNPKAGLSYFIFHSDENQSKIYGSYANANKEPNRDDFEASPLDLPKPEHLQDWELGYQFQTPQFQAGVNGYYMQYKNQLILTGKINDVGAYVRTNVPESYRLGMEFTAGAIPLPWLQLQANASFSKNKIKAITQFADDYDNGGQLEMNFSNSDIALSPNIIGAATLTLEPFYKILASTRHFYVDFLGKHVGRQYLDNASDQMKSLNPYTLADFRLRYQMATKNFRDINLILMVNNVFNKKYENNGYTFSYQDGGRYITENYYFPQAGTNWNLGLSFSL